MSRCFPVLVLSTFEESAMHLGMKTMLAAAALMTVAGLGMTTASAMPVTGLSTAVQDNSAQLDQVRFGCGRWGCQRAPNRWRGRGHHYGWRRH